MAADPIVAPPRPRAPQRPRLRPAPPPRRVSGPDGGATTVRSGRAASERAGATARAAAPAKPRIAKPRPAKPRVGARRMSGGAVALPVPATPLHRVLEGLRALPDARWLERLLRGQGWIILIGAALMGIVFLQVSLLKMNAGIGQSVERSAALERSNADLRAEVSRLSSEERIAAAAAKLGLVMPDAGEHRYVRVRGEVDARKAAAVMRAPDPVDETATTTADPAAAATATAPATTAAPETTTPEATEPATPPGSLIR